MSSYGLSSTLANATMNIFNGTAVTANAYTTTGTVYVALHTGAPGSAGTSNAAVGSTTRAAATFGSASSGAVTTTGTQPSWTNGGTSETLTAVSVWSASTSGTYLGCATLTSSQAWASGNVYSLSSLTFTSTPAS